MSWNEGFSPFAICTYPALTHYEGPKKRLLAISKQAASSHGDYQESTRRLSTFPSTQGRVSA